MVLSTMNHFFKVIWNQAKNCLVAVSETASSKSSANLKPNKIQTAVMSALAAMSLSQTAMAADPIDDANVDNPVGTTITGTAGYGVKLDAGGPFTVANSGEIRSTGPDIQYGIQLLARDITLLENTSTGVIKGVEAEETGVGIRLVSSSNINVLNNSGVILGSASDYGIGLELSKNSTIGTLTNTGTISGSASDDDAYGLKLQTASIITLTNNGLITASAEDSDAYGLKLQTASIITLTNNGLITASAEDSEAFGIFMDKSSINTLINAGTISGLVTNGETGAGIYLDESTITTLNNSGLINFISGGYDTDLSAAIILDAGSSINTLINSGTISAIQGDDSSYTLSGIYLNDKSFINNLTNTGVISATGSESSNYGIYINNISSIATLTNSGTILASSIEGESYAYGIYLYDTSSVGTITNSGTISASAAYEDAYGIYVNDTSTVGTITNSGLISAIAGTDAAGILIRGGETDGSSVGTITNSGTITASADDSNAYGIKIESSSSVGTLTNSGLISASAVRDAYGIDIHTSTVTTLNNSGTISVNVTATVGSSSSMTGIHVFNTSSVNNLTNSGLISLSISGVVETGFQKAGAIRVSDASTVTTLTNSGIISLVSEATHSTGVLSGINVQDTSSHIVTLNNLGIISVTADNSANGIRVATGGIITTLTNSGSIDAYGSGAYDIKNNGGVITTFNNKQTGLTYSGTLPDNYTSIVNNTSYGQLFVSNEAAAAAGATAYTPFAGAANIGVAIKSGTYTNVMTGISSANIGATRSGTLTGDGTSSAGSTAWTLNETASGSKAWNLNATGNYFYFGSVAALQNSIDNTANYMRGAFNSITTSMNFANMTTYDCNLFGNDGSCVSVGGRYTGTDNRDTTATAVVAKVGYKFNEHFRWGAFVDQTASSKTGNVDLDTHTPMMGFMGVWNQNTDQLGMQVKLANTYQQTGATITRNGLGSGDDYRGDTDIDAQSYVAELSWRQLNNQKDTLLQPFVAIRYAIIDQDAYSDGFVNYGGVEQKTLTALAGVKAFYQYSHKMTYLGSLGVEYDLNEDADDLSVSVSGVSGLTAASMTSGGEDKTRLLGSIGARFFVTPNQRLEAKLMYEQLRYNNADSTTAYVNYAIGF